MKHTLSDPTMKRQTMQKWVVGARVRLTKGPEPALDNVPKTRLTGTGTIKSVMIRFPRTPSLRAVAYTITLDNELLGESLWTVTPGSDSFYVELI